MLIERMKNSEGFTSQEQNIINYILKNPKVIYDCSAKDLAALTYTSSSTVVRLCKKLGVNGYPDFKLEFVKNYNIDQKINSVLTYNQTINLNNTEEISDVILTLYNRIFTETKKMLDFNTLNNIIKQIKLAKRVDLYGEHINQHVARQISCKLDNLGINSAVHSGINLQYINNLSPKSKRETVSFILSRTGMNPAMIQIASLLKSNNMNPIAICSDFDTPLSKLCSNTLRIYFDDIILFQSSASHSLSIEYIFDIILTKLHLDMSKPNSVPDNLTPHLK